MPPQFWKQFFEASANVSLSGYEELAADETVTEDYTATETTDTSDAYASSPSRANDDDTITAASKDPATHDEGEDSLLESLTISPSQPTPRAPQTQTKPPTFAQYPSPYEALKREVHATTNTTNAPPSTISSELPSTPGKQTLPDMSLTPTSSPFAPPTSAFRPSSQQRKDLLLHRVLDKNYRLQATPHAQPRLPHRTDPTAQTPKANSGNRQRDSTSPMSSPPIPAPELHSEIFDSPQRRPPRTPGVSVLAGGLTPRKSKSAKRTGGGWDSDSEGDDDYGDDGLLEGMSPPKTMQFHVPQSRVLQTPGKFPRYFPLRPVEMSHALKPLSICMGTDLLLGNSTRSE